MYILKRKFWYQKQALDRRCSTKKVVLKNFTKFKHLWQSLFFDKVAGHRHRFFPVNFMKF